MASRFDDKASTWDDDPARVRRGRLVAAAIRAAVPLPTSARVLEYGAGTGLMSQALAPFVGPITLAEPSEGMRAVLAEKVAAGALPADARIWDLDLAFEEAPDERFDLVATVLVLHHIPDVARVLHGFAGLLTEGGHLCVVDLEEEDGSFHDGSDGFDVHHGFARATLTELMVVAGFVDVRFEPCSEVEKHGTPYPMFLAVAARGDG